MGPGATGGNQSGGQTRRRVKRKSTMPKITKQLIDSTAAPAAGDTWLWDTDLPGFGVRIQASGRKTYVLRYRTKDAKRTQRKLTVCRTCDAPPDKARGMAREHIQAIAMGADPAAERKPEPASAITVEAMFKARIAAMRAKNRANAGEVERVLLLAKNNAADSIGRTKPPGEVTSADIVKFVSTFYLAGHRGAADKARGYLAAAFGWAIKSANDYTVANRQDWGVKHNPAADVAKDHGAIKVRDRNLSADEIRTLWDLCQDGNAGFAAGIELVIRVMLACGQRVQETLRMCGSEIDLEAKTWHMPAHKTKGKKRDHIIPLPDIIIPDLRRAKETHGDGTLFPARSDSASETIGAISVSHAVRRWLEKDSAELAAFQPRDLRRTWKSRTHDAGVDRFTRDLIQQHAKNDTGSKNYDRADYLPQMREAMDKWSAWLDAVVNPRPALTLVA